jgi:hypothetical protein
MRVPGRTMRAFAVGCLNERFLSPGAARLLAVVKNPPLAPAAQDA